MPYVSIADRDGKAVKIAAEETFTGSGIFALQVRTDDFDDAAAITPNDGADLPGGVSNGLWVTVSGNVAIVTKGGTSLTLAVTAGTRLPIKVARVKATGTTATVVALY